MKFSIALMGISLLCGRIELWRSAVWSKWGLEAISVEAAFDPGMYDGTGVGALMAQMISAGPLLANIIITMLIMAIGLVIMKAMEGSPRTLYQRAQTAGCRNIFPAQ